MSAVDDLTEALRWYYRTLSVRRRMTEFLGGPALCGNRSAGADQRAGDSTSSGGYRATAKHFVVWRRSDRFRPAWRHSTL